MAWKGKEPKCAEIHLMQRSQNRKEPCKEKEKTKPPVLLYCHRKKETKTIVRASPTLGNQTSKSARASGLRGPVHDFNSCDDQNKGAGQDDHHVTPEENVGDYVFENVVDLADLS